MQVVSQARFFKLHYRPLSIHRREVRAIFWHERMLILVVGGGNNNIHSQREIKTLESRVGSDATKRTEMYMNDWGSGSGSALTEDRDHLALNRPLAVPDAFGNQNRIKLGVGWL